MKPLLTIDGIDGSGKSTFAARLADALGAQGWPAAILRVDDFRQEVAWAAGAEASVYYDSYYDLADCERCLAAFTAGAPSAVVPVFDSARDRRGGTRALDFAAARVAILEGVFPLRMPTAAASFLIYLHASPTEARRRIIARDLQKGRTQAQIEHRIAERYFPAQDRYRGEFDPRMRAGVVIDNERPAAPRALMRDLGALPPDLAAALDAALPR